MKRRSALKLFGSTAALAVARPAWSQSAAPYPNRAIKIIVSSTPGSATDVAGRLVGDLLAARYGQSIVIENKPGAGGVIGMTAAAAATPDGYTITTGGLGHNVLPPVTLRGLPIDIPKALLPVAQVAEFVNVLVVRPDHPANNVQELIAYLKNRPNKALYGSNGVGSSSQMTSELFAIQAKLPLDHVPYKGASEALVGTSMGDLDLCFMNLPPTLAMVRAGKLKALAVTSSYRVRQLPDVPTMQEQGMSDFDVTSWLGMYVPSKVDPAIVAQLSRDIVEGMSTPEQQNKLIAAGLEPKLRDAQAFQAFTASELQRWATVAQAANIVVEYGGKS
ncbi:Bug family tripartite tricarboxylate transporter substrate binding protein [Bordetella sp. 02P26C-1]|uniref:Bug family tripartite tricarboxylate transporter substrate binding protein n=1 Tax=Bordetella sp. 02P26C-1 TaxID=2683195 RepID=UPI001353B5A3|nr:tripartite tricarboxylate transporter substrate binding protein [Bordetella sp. 02P26C-1]MVW77538.1 tripartite tricarboxylate transporter substrate binding protein [Bordetella sp. 02P26C-1]